MGQDPDSLPCGRVKKVYFASFFCLFGDAVVLIVAVTWTRHAELPPFFSPFITYTPGVITFNFITYQV